MDVLKCCILLQKIMAIPPSHPLPLHNNFSQVTFRLPILHQFSATQEPLHQQTVPATLQLAASWKFPPRLKSSTPSMTRLKVLPRPWCLEAFLFSCAYLLFTRQSSSQCGRIVWPNVTKTLQPLGLSSAHTAIYTRWVAYSDSDIGMAAQLVSARHSATDSQLIPRPRNEHNAMSNSIH